MNKFLDEFGLSRSDVENWLARDSVELRTDYEPTIKGRARDFTRLNVIELAVVGALVAGGMRPSRAPRFAEIIVNEVRHGIVQSEWLAFSANDDSNPITKPELSSTEIMQLADSAPSKSVTIIHTGEIVRRAWNLFYPTESKTG